VPPNLKADNLMKINETIIKVTDVFLISFPNNSIIITGDLNNLNYKHLEINTNCLNIIKEPTRGNKILHYFLVHEKLKDVYSNSIIGSPISNSDHKTIIITPNHYRNHQSIKKYEVYDYQHSNL